MRQKKTLTLDEVSENETKKTTLNEKAWYETSK